MTTELSVNHAVPPALADEYAELSGLDVGQLRDELSKALHLSAAYMRRLAVIVRLLEERGEDLSAMQVRLLPFLRQIAYGQILPEIVIRFGDSPGLARVIGRLPLPDQARIARGEGVPLVVRRGNDFDHRLVDPSSLGIQQYNQVFGRGGIRPIAEQTVLLESRPEKPDRPASVKGAPRVDRYRQGILLGKKFVSRDNLAALLLELNTEPNWEEDEDFEKTLPIKLTAAEHAALKRMSIDTGNSMTTLIRRAMKKEGLI